jgi:Putative Actinobacterial Holin-X, holin superfamily III
LATEPEQPQNIAVTVTEVTERVSLLIREEIELAKAEVTEKITRLAKGAVVGIASGIFVVTALLFILHGFAWLFWFEVTPGSGYWGYFVVAGALILLGVVAGLAAGRAVRSGAPPTPTMAIDEARKIREAVTSSPPPAPDPLAPDPLASDPTR